MNRALVLSDEEHETLRHVFLNSHNLFDYGTTLDPNFRDKETNLFRRVLLAPTTEAWVEDCKAFTRAFTSAMPELADPLTVVPNTGSN